MKDAKSKALDKKTHYKKIRSEARKYFRDKGYTNVKEKSYFDRNHQERHNIRSNMKEGSSMHHYLHSKPRDVKAFQERNNPFPKAFPSEDKMSRNER